MLQSQKSFFLSFTHFLYSIRKADFVSKMSISLKEANETEYWICILKDTNYIEQNLFERMQSDCKELMAILVSSIKTAKK
ncbi:MAG: four helix bundle protein [Bacteroidia bacterium]|nr:four helix bundle protein [Bacteroidia bacterium]